MAKQILFHKEARKKLKLGIDKVAKAVRVTIGPFGRNVALAKSYGGPTITNDGVSITKEISLQDPYEQMGAEIVKEVASKTNEVAGDGTSTSIILVDSMIQGGLRQVDNRDSNALGIRRGIEKAHKQAEEQLDAMKRDVSTDEDVVRIATIAAESEEYGKIIAETVQKVGDKGVVTVEESQSFEIESEVVEGLEINKGYISPYMMTNPERLEAEYKNVPILLTDKKISSIKEILPFLEKLTQTGQKDLVIIADDVDGEALTTFIVNKLRGTLNILAIKAPGYGDKKKELLSDIAVTVGAQAVSADLNMSFDTIGLEVLGKASRIVAKKDTTIIVGATGDNSSQVQERVKMRVKTLQSHVEQTTSKFDKDQLQERIAKLSGGVAVIRVGAVTESEMKYLKLKIENAVSATKAAIEEGIVVGGGSVLAHVAHVLRETGEEGKNGDTSEIKGREIFINALEAPLQQIVENALGDGRGKSVVRSVQKKGGTAGYDALKKVLVDDMFSEGIIDPVKVTRSALQHAVSTAGIFLTTEAAVVDIPEKVEGGDAVGGGANPMMGGGMY